MAQPSVIAGLSPAVFTNLGDVIQIPLLSSNGATVTKSGTDGEYDFAGTSLNWLYPVAVYDDDTGIDHIQSPFRVWRGGTIRAIDTKNVLAATAVSAWQALGFTVQTVTGAGGGVAAGNIVAAKDINGVLIEIDDLLNVANVVVLTVSNGDAQNKPGPLLAMRANGIILRIGSMGLNVSGGLVQLT